jgi:hypothetical protein
MAEKSYWFTTNNTGDGPPVGTGYSRTDLAHLSAIMAACSHFEGVAPGYLNTFNGTTATNQATIATGGAMVDGRQYRNDTAVNVTIPSAVGGGNTRIDRIVLRANWTAQTVRIFRIAGTDAASPTAPAITQTSGTTYDITLYQALVNTSGLVALIEERVWAGGRLTRQGGSATDWSTAGANNYAVQGARNYVGYTTWTGSSATSGNKVVTFPAPFVQGVAAMAQPVGNDAVRCVVDPPSASEFRISWVATSNQTSITFVWMATGY